MSYSDSPKIAQRREANTSLHCISIHACYIIDCMMTKKNYVIIARSIFALIAGAHLLRLLLGWNITIDATPISPIASIAAIVIAGILSLNGFTIIERRSNTD